MTTASWVAGAPGQFACMAAQSGTDAALGSGDGDGDGEGVGVGEGLGAGLAEVLGDGDWLGWATAGPFAEQALTASTAPMSTNPVLTRS